VKLTDQELNALKCTAERALQAAPDNRQGQRFVAAVSELVELREELEFRKGQARDALAQADSARIANSIKVGLRTEFAALLGVEGVATDDQVAKGLERLKGLVKDGQRLDWINKKMPHLDRCRSKFYVGDYARNGSMDNGYPDFRDAVDAAQEAAP